jgi:hypothetical protein
MIDSKSRMFFRKGLKFRIECLLQVNAALLFEVVRKPGELGTHLTTNANLNEFGATFWK